MLINNANSAEIAPFRVTGIDGKVYVRYFTDEYVEKSSGVETNRREGTTAEEGLDLTVHSYIYHPNFFRLDFGGGPVFVQRTYDTDTEDYSNDDQYYNFHARGSILEKKPYPLILFYDRYSSTTPFAVQERSLLTSEKYGLNFKLKKPLLPALVVFDLSRYELDGDNPQRSTDETTDRASVKISGDLGPNGDGNIGYFWKKTQSASGSVSLPINETSRTTHLIDGRTDHSFGYEEWIRFTNHFIYREQDDLPEIDEIRYTPSLYLTHARNLNSYYRYSYLDKTVEEIDTTSHSFDAGVNHTSFDDRLNTSIDLSAETYNTEGLQQDFYQGNVNLSYLQPFDGFKIRYSGGWGYDYTDRVGDDVSVVAERQSLDSFNAFELNNRNVIEVSVVVKNEAQTQTYVRGIHYELVSIDDTTRIQWIDLNDIPERVVADYSYESGGTAEFTTLRQRYRIDFNRGQYLKLFAGYRSIERNLESGNPTIPLNSEDTTTIGMQVDYPLKNNWIVGGNAEHEEHDADIGSYRSDAAGAYLQFPKVLKGSLRLFADKLLVDHEDSEEDVDLTRYGLRYHSRPWPRTRLNANIVDETDTGGTVERSATRASVRLSWAYRQLDLAAEGRYYIDEIGESESERSSINLILTRNF